MSTVLEASTHAAETCPRVVIDPTMGYAPERGQPGYEWASRDVVRVSPDALHLLPLHPCQIPPGARQWRPHGAHGEVRG